MREPRLLLSSRSAADVENGPKATSPMKSSSSKKTSSTDQDSTKHENTTRVTRSVAIGKDGRCIEE